LFLSPLIPHRPTHPLIIWGLGVSEATSTGKLCTFYECVFPLASRSPRCVAGGGRNVQPGEKATYWMLQAFVCRAFIVAAAARGNPELRAIISQLSSTRLLISRRSLPRALIYGRVHFFPLLSLFWATNSPVFPSSTSGQRGIITAFPRWSVWKTEWRRGVVAAVLIPRREGGDILFFLPAPPGKTQS